MSQGNETDRELLDMAQAIELLGTTRATFYRWLRAGRISGHKAGRQWRFERAEIQRFLRGDARRIELRADIQPLLDQLERSAGDSPAPLSLPSGTIIERALVMMLQAALAGGASAIHLEPGLGSGGSSMLRHRSGRELIEVASIDHRLHSPILDEWRRASGCAEIGGSRAAEGRIDLEIEGEAVTVHVEIVPTYRGDTMTARLHRSTNLFGLDALPFRDEIREQLRKAARLPHGLLVCSGPTGSGKTTTLFACVIETAGPDRKVMSLEEPVEYPLPWTTQVQIDDDAGLTFDRALRAALRSDLDAILIGEIARGEHARAAQRAAQWGHLVLSTFHADSAAQTLARIAELSGDALGLSDLPGLILGQRLVRRLCKECKAPTKLSGGDLKLAREIARTGGLEWSELESDWQARVGCATCNELGYRGRAAVQEVLQLDAPVRAALQRHASAEELQATAIDGGMVALAADAVRLASEGVTSFQEVRALLGSSALTLA